MVEDEITAGVVERTTNLAQVAALVVNEGTGGDVVVYVEMYDDRDAVLERFEREISLEEDERRRVTVQVYIPLDAEGYEAAAEAA